MLCDGFSSFLRGCFWSSISHPLKYLINKISIWNSMLHVCVYICVFLCVQVCVCVCTRMHMSMCLYVPICTCMGTCLGGQMLMSCLHHTLANLISWDKDFHSTRSTLIHLNLLISITLFYPQLSHRHVSQVLLYTIFKNWWVFILQSKSLTISSS